MNVETTLEANARFAETGKPCMYVLDDPAMPSEPLVAFTPRRAIRAVMPSCGTVRLFEKSANITKASIAALPPAEAPVSFKGYRFPPDIICYAVWLYSRFPLSLRMVEEMLAARGVELTYETVRSWAAKFGLSIAKRIRATATGRGDGFARRRRGAVTSGIWTKWS